MDASRSFVRYIFNFQNTRPLVRTRVFSVSRDVTVNLTLTHRGYLNSVSCRLCSKLVNDREYMALGDEEKHTVVEAREPLAFPADTARTV